MEYPFLSPPARLDTADPDYSIPLYLCRNYHNRILRMHCNGEKTPWGRPPFKLIEIPEGTRFWQNSIQPFLEAELNKKLAFQGKTRQHWEEEQVLAREARRAEDDAVMAALQSKKAAEKVRKEREVLERIRQERGFIGYWRLELLGFKSDVRRTFKSIWSRKIERKVYKPRYLSSPSWMKFWVFLQEKILHPVRWKYSVAYQLQVMQQISSDLTVSLYMFGYREDLREEAEALKAVWEEIERRMDVSEARHKFWLMYRYYNRTEAFALALAPLYEWEDAHQEAQKLKAKAEQGKRFVEAAKVLSAPTTGNTLGGVQ
jgi:hypothetical protein